MMIERVGLVVCAVAAGCVYEGSPGGSGSPGTSAGETEAGATAAETEGSPETDGAGTDTDETGGEATDACAPQLDVSCGEVSAPTVRGLEGAEWLGVSTRDGTTDLVFGESELRRQPPTAEHPGYLLVFWPGTEGTMQAPLTAQTHADLMVLRAAVPDGSGPVGLGRDATVRIGDRQLCVGRDEGCDALDALLEYTSALDEALLLAWQAQDAGTLHPIEEVAFEPWTLDVPWGVGGPIDVTQAQWESLDAGWFVDDRGRFAHVRRYCTGTSDGCNQWTIEIDELTVLSSPLSADQDRDLLTLSTLGWPGFGLPLSGPDFTTLRDAHVLLVEDPDDAAVTHTLTTIAIPQLVLDHAF